jgi:hypothetical protein
MDFMPAIPPSWDMHGQGFPVVRTLPAPGKSGLDVFFIGGFCENPHAGTGTMVINQFL